MSSICVAVLLIGVLFSRKSILPESLSTSGLPTAFEDSKAPDVFDVCPVIVSPFAKAVYPVLLFCA
jgi:hypothetical protein